MSFVCSGVSMPCSHVNSRDTAGTKCASRRARGERSSMGMDVGMGVGVGMDMGACVGMGMEDHGYGYVYQDGLAYMCIF